MARGKHSADGGLFFCEREKKIESVYNDDYYLDDSAPKARIIISIILIILIICIGFFITKKYYFGNENKANEVVAENVVENNMLDIYESFKVLGKIKIDKLGVEEYILDSKSEDALKKGVIKLYGTSLNNYGNLCLAGHNTEKIFGRLQELNVGDSIILIDKDLSETIYEVKESLTVEPDNLTELLQNDEKVELTLITCKDGSTERLIIKAEEKR